MSKKPKKPHVPFKQPPPTPAEANPEAVVENHELHDAMVVVMVMGCLTPEEADILVACIGHGCKEDRVAEELNLTPSAVKNMKARALEKLKVAARGSSLEQMK